MIKSPDDYRASLRDGRCVFLDGKRVDDVTAHPLIAPSVDWVAEGYRDVPDMRRGELWEGNGLREHFAALADGDPTLTSTFALGALQHPNFQEGLQDLGLASFLEECCESGRRIVMGRLEPRQDALKVEGGAPGGVRVSGALGAIVGAAVSHELVVLLSPRARQSSGVYGIAIPLTAPGVQVISTVAAPRSEDTRHYPVSRNRSIPDGSVYFDEVVVPEERCFRLDAEGSSDLFDAVVNLWETASSLGARSREAHLIVGLGQVIAEMNGVADVNHIREKLSAMTIYASQCEAAWEAAFGCPETLEGVSIPNRAFMSSGLAYATAEYTRVVGLLHDIAGALLLTVPTVADYDHPDTHEYMEKYLRTMAGVTGADRMTVFHLIRDLTADTFWGWKKVVRQFVGGGSYRQNMAALDAYRMKAARQAVVEAANLRDWK